VNDDRLRADFARIAAGLPSADHTGPALALGRKRLRRRRSVRGVAVVALGAAAFSWYGVTGAGTAPASASVACYADRVVVTRHPVSVGRGGVRLDVTNATPSAVRLLAGDAGAILPPGHSAIDVLVRPGVVTVSCDSGAAVVPAASLVVVDKRGVFVDDSLDCAAADVRSVRGTGDPRLDDIASGDPVALTSARLRGALPAGAVVEPAGYPDAAQRRFVRVRQGTHIVGVAVWHEMPQPGTWALDALRVCR
jgi:hypothetical protein